MDNQNNERYNEADNVVVRGGDDVPYMPAGSFQAVLCDIIDQGVVSTANGPQDRVKLVFQVRLDNGERKAVQRVFNKSLGQNSHLSLFLESWRGLPLTKEERAAGFSLRQLIGKNCLLNIIHQPSKDGQKTWINIAGVAPWKQSFGAPIAVEGYVRPAPKDNMPTDSRVVNAPVPPQPQQTQAAPAQAPATSDDSDIPF